MTPPLEFALRIFHLSLLRGASLLVPRQRRSEWSQEWNAELWYVLRECSSATRAFRKPAREATAFCLGAYADAFCLRRQLWQKQSPYAPMRGSASLCLLLLSALLAVSWCVALRSPGVRAEHDLSRYRVYSELMLRQDAGHESKVSPTLSPEEQFWAWTGSRQRFFDDVAFYRIGQETISAISHAQGGWAVVHASSNLFALLNLSVRFAPPHGKVDRGLPKLILSNRVWRTDFGGNPHITGDVVRVGFREARIAGVAPIGSWRLPGKVDAWLLEPESEMRAGETGSVVAHLKPWGDFEMGPRWAISLLAVLLAFLSLPAITSVSMGEYGLDSRTSSLTKRLYRWGFLSAKIALLLPIVYFASLDIAYSCMSSFSPQSGYIQFASSFSICLFGLRWALRDQQQRCPICLRRVAHPARVGQLSRTFLAWNGTELICINGHTLLHVPEMPTSWFDKQRWLYLDPSWQFLFAGSNSGAGKS